MRFFGLPKIILFFASVCYRKNIDFEGVLGGFGDGFGRSKSLIFAFFSRKNASKKQEDFWKAKKSHFEASRANCGRSAAVRAGPGEGIKGWGKALVAGILGFAFEAVLGGRQIGRENE